MADAAPKTDAARTEGGRGGFRRGFGDRGGRGGRGGGPGGAPGGRPRDDKDNWTPMTKLGRLVKYGKIKTLEEVFVNSIPIKEAEIVDTLIKNKKKFNTLSDEVMKIISVQKQTKSGQRTRFKAVVAIGDHDGHMGLGVKVAKEVQIAIRGALTDAKLNISPVRRGYWGGRLGEVHTVPMKVTGKCGSVSVRLVPAPRGTGIVGAPVTKKLLQFAGVDDCFTSSTGCTKTLQNFVFATFHALRETYRFLTPDLWPKTDFLPSPFVKHANFLKAQAATKRGGPRERGDREGGRGGRGGRGRGGFGRGGADRGDRGDRGDRAERTAPPTNE